MNSRRTTALSAVRWLWIGALAATMLPAAASPDLADRNTMAAPPAAAPATTSGDENVSPEDNTPPPASAAADGAAEAEAASPPESPYQAIIVRNAFGLRPPQPAAPPPDPAAQVNTTALKLTGINTLGLRKYAMFVTQEGGKQLVSDLVGENEKDTVITNLEVVAIDGRNGVVRVLYGGKELSLNFADNGLKAPVAAPGAPQVRPVGPMVSSGQPLVPNPAAAAAAASRFGAITAPGAGAVPTFGTPDSPSGLNRSLPTRPTRGTSRGYSPGSAFNPGMLTSDANQATAAANQPVVPPEQQLLLMHAQEQISAAQNIPFPPSPPIPGSPTTTTTTTPGANPWLPPGVVPPALPGLPGGQ
jgi:hypothetical protein